MPYTKTDWVDGITPLNEANLDKMEQGIFTAQGAAETAQAKADGAVASDSVVVAATRLVASKLLLADAQPAVRILGNGKIEWGPGGATAPDTNLYRYFADQLATDDNFRIRPDVAGTDLTLGGVGVGTCGIKFGTDTTLSRQAAGVLKTDGQLGSANERGYVERTTPLSLTGSWQTALSLGPITFDGSTVVLVEFWCPYIQLQDNVGSPAVWVGLRDNGNPLGDCIVEMVNVGADVHNFMYVPVSSRRHYTPTSGAHTFQVWAYATSTSPTVPAALGAGDGTAYAPAFLRVQRVN